MARSKASYKKVRGSGRVAMRSSFLLSAPEDGKRSAAIEAAVTRASLIIEARWKARKRPPQISRGQGRPHDMRTPPATAGGVF